MQHMLTELKLNQKNATKMFTENELLVRSLQKRSKRLYKLGSISLTLIAGCTIKYVDSDVTLRNLLVASRDFNEVLGSVVYK